MAEIPRPPDMMKADLADLRRYHAKLGDYLGQLTDAQSSLSFVDNLGAVVTEPTPVQVTSNAFSAAGIEVPCDFEPWQVLFKASKLDSNGRTTGEVFNGTVSWRTGTRSGADGFTALSGVLADGRYLLSLMALPG